MSVFSYNVADIWNQQDVSRKGRKLDFLWLMHHALQIENIPMWVGFNSKFYVDNLPKQVVLYMGNIQEPITALAVVRETMKRAQKCAHECNQKYAVLTYDLNAAKLAFQI